MEGVGRAFLNMEVGLMLCKESSEQPELLIYFNLVSVILT